MTQWTIDTTGDLLTIDDSLTMAGHRAEIQRAARAWTAFEAPRLKRIGATVRVVGEHYTLDVLSGPYTALRAAGLSDWTEQPR